VTAKHATAAIFVHHPKCSIQSVNGAIEALTPHYKFKIFTKHLVEDDFFNDVDVVVFPGGVGSSDSYDYLMRENHDHIIKFVNNGGKYLGICMGAYWAGSYYFNILKDADAVQYITRPETDTRRPHAKNIEVEWNGKKERMFFFDGCAIVGNNKSFDTVATYNNGDPMAIIQNNIGLIGCHPESQPYWYTLHSWMKGKYHEGKQHKLLLEFTDQLLKR